MALIKCAECNKDISDKALSCPHCGNPMNENKTIQNTQTQNNEELLKCPKCKSTQLTSNKKGYSAGKAAAGVVLTGGIGLLAGAIGSGRIDITCLQCGHKYRAGEYEKEVQNINKPSDAEIIEKNPLQFVIVFSSLLLGIFIPLFGGGSWWYLLIMPIVGFILLFLIEKARGSDNIKESNKPSNSHSNARLADLDNTIKIYIKQGKMIQAVDLYRSALGVSFAEAKDHVDTIASNL